MAKAKKPIDFRRASFEITGRVQGKGAVKYIRRIKLSDNTEYSCDYPRWVWRKYKSNPEFRRFPDTRGWYVTCNERIAGELESAWRDNFSGNNPFLISED